MMYKTKGLMYFPIDVNLLSQRNIRVLRSQYGDKGILLYIYLCMDIYREGYYIDYDEEMAIILAGELNIDFEKVSEMIAFIVKHNLFDSKMFADYGILTSLNIQQRFQYAVSARGYKNHVQVKDIYWLIPLDETKSYMDIIDENGNSIEKTSNSMENKNNSMETDTNKIKEKENKIKLNNTTPTPAEGEEECHEKSDFSEITEELRSNGFGKITKCVRSGINTWLSKVDKSVIIWAIHEAALNNKLFWNYVNAALERNYNNGNTTLEDMLNARNKFRTSRSSSVFSERSASIYSSDDTDYAEIERRMNEKYE